MIATLGVLSFVQTPEVLWALSPHPCGRVLRCSIRSAAFLALGSVVLAVTGAEALYADMGHFGRKPIRVSWLFFVLPALILNYMGQARAADRATGRRRSKAPSTCSRPNGSSCRW